MMAQEPINSFKPKLPKIPPKWEIIKALPKYLRAQASKPTTVLSGWVCRYNYPSQNKDNGSF